MPAPLDEIFRIMRDVLRDKDLELSPATRFEDLTNWDSMDLINLVVQIECTYDLLFELAEIDRLVAVTDLLSAITVKQALATT